MKSSVNFHESHIQSKRFHNIFPTGNAIITLKCNTYSDSSYVKFTYDDGEGTLFLKGHTSLAIKNSLNDELSGSQSTEGNPKRLNMQV